ATAVMIFGVITIAAEARLRVSEMLAPAPPFEAWLSAGGASLFLLGSAGFRLALRFGSVWPRVLAALRCVVAVPASRYDSAAAGLFTIAIVIGVALEVEHLYERRAIRRPLAHPHGTSA